MKTRQLIIILITIFLSGCLQSTFNLPPGKSKLDKIETGTRESSVRTIAGKPHRVVKSKNGYSTYYYKEKLTSDCKKDLQTCIPIVIERKKVVAIGHKGAKAWKQKRKRTISSGSSSSSGSSGSSGKTDHKTTRQEIEKLERQVRAIPVSRTVDNLNIYRYLLKLDPDNPRYQKKVAFYENRFEKEGAKRVAERKLLAASWKWQNERLKEFKGDTRVQMAVKIIGNGKFHVWLKNTGKKPFRVEARQFFLSCEKDKRYMVYSSKDFDKDVAPGAVIEGRITFVIYCNPRKIIYANPDVATLSRAIPVPELQADAPPAASNPPRGKKK